MKDWVDVAQFAWIIVGTVWMFWWNRTDKTQAQVTALSETVAALSLTVARMQAVSDQAPTHDDIGEVHEKLNDVGTKVERIGGDVRAATAEVRGLRDLVNSEVAGLSEIVTGVRRQLEIVNEHLLSQRNHD